MVAKYFGHKNMSKPADLSKVTPNEKCCNIGFISLVKGKVAVYPHPPSLDFFWNNPITLAVVIAKEIDICANENCKNLHWLPKMHEIYSTYL